MTAATPGPRRCGFPRCGQHHPGEEYDPKSALGPYNHPAPVAGSYYAKDASGPEDGYGNSPQRLSSASEKGAVRLDIPSGGTHTSLHPKEAFVTGAPNPAEDPPARCERHDIPYSEHDDECCLIRLRKVEGERDEARNLTHLTERIARLEALVRKYEGFLTGLASERVSDEQYERFVLERAWKKRFQYWEYHAKRLMEARAEAILDGKGERV